MANPYFNGTYYLANNPDLFAAGINTVEGAWAHYVQFGAAEALQGAASRSPAPWFDIAYYLKSNSDLATAGLTAGQLFEHFINFGIEEGRQPSADANVNSASLAAYAAANADLREAFGIEEGAELTPAQELALAQHFYAFGYAEPREGKPAEYEPEDPNTGETFTLTVGIDNIVGTAADEVITAPVVQNFLGQLVNTLETGDKIDGGAGFDTLNVTLTHSQSSDSPASAPAISATVSNVEVINLRNQYDSDDGMVNNSNIDAELHSGVQQYWSDNSRYDLQIEDVRQLPEELTFGMRQTDPTQNGVTADFSVYFDPAQLAADRSTSGDSSLTLTLVDNTPDADELANFPVNGIVFNLGGTEYTVQTEGALGATYAEFAENLQAALAANPDLADITVTLNDNNTITLVDPEGAAFEAVGYTWVNNVVPSDGNLQWNMTVGAAIEDDQPITTSVVLDAVGRTSQGGTLDIGSMADGGVEVFNVSVDRDSWVTALESREDFGAGDRHLETVTLTSIGANGDVAIGDAVGANVTGALDGRVVNGLTDVREVLNQGFAGDMSYGVSLTNNSISRYLDDAEEAVQFTYEGGDGNDNVTIIETGVLSGDDDFAMSVDLGAGDDRLNLDVDNVSNVTVDGGEGNNTIAVSSDHGIDADNTFAEFANFQTYEVEGAGSAHDFESMQGVTTINVATDVPAASTTLVNVARDAEVTITGKNQTLGNNSNNNQDFGTISIDSEEVLGGDNTLRVTLQNTARLDGVLTVAGLVVGDLDGDDDGIRTLDLVSAGSRNTSNVVDVLNAALVNTFNLTGTQDLDVTISAAANSTATVDAQRDALVVNGAELGGTLDLELDGAIVTAVNGASKTVTLTGTANDDDVVVLSGGGLDVTNNTTVTGFETVGFVAASGEVDVTNFNGVALYEIASTAGDFEMNGMSGDEQVWADADFLGGELTFVAAVEATTNVLDLELETSVGGGVAADVTAQGFRTISLELTGTSTTDDAFTIALELLDEDGNVPTTAAEFATVYARTLVITGGGDQGAAGAAGGVDTVDLATTPLTNVLSTIDLSDYVGTTTLTLDNNAIAGRNVTIELNGYGADLTEVDGADANIVTYKFTTDLIAGEVVEINGFEGNNGIGGDPAFAVGVDDVSILDLRDLGITGLADLNMVDDGTDTTITSNGDHDFEIVLMGIQVADLSNENFMFAA